MMMNLARAIHETFDLLFRHRVWRGTVTGVSGNRVTVTRGVQTEDCATLASYADPQEADEVIVLRVGDGYVAIGKVLR